MEFFWTIYIVILGFCIGSFINVVIYRFPKGKSLLYPRSFCPKCESKIEWFDERDLPSKPEVEAEIDRLITEEPKRLLRVERDKRLTDSDWVVTKAFETGGAVPESWKTYRQALRDLPEKSNPKLNEYGDLDMKSVSWPDKPSS